MLTADLLRRKNGKGGKSQEFPQHFSWALHLSRKAYRRPARVPYQTLSVVEGASVHTNTWERRPHGRSHRCVKIARVSGHVQFRQFLLYGTEYLFIHLGRGGVHQRTCHYADVTISIAVNGEQLSAPIARNYHICGACMKRCHRRQEIKLASCGQNK